MSTASAGPRSGYALEVLRYDRSTTLCWGEGADGGDVVATRDGRVLTWASPEDCFAAAAVEGWDVAHDETTRTDLTPALEWLAHRRRALDAEAALHAWNLAGDIARSTGTPWGDRGRVADACHRKLTVACVPRLVGQDDCSPRWTVTEERYLRRRVGAAIALFDQQVVGRRRQRP
ncbi:hypothetical protein [Oerskovia enterophila]|uniref:Uncharacterized protein n=1 Tax=Oerskovia enterophila TaxID=43678 RepID=A0ABX2XZ94_9CELL|nr:hypothetical protein [Oerskovia enterophila]OCI29536.1 hypothetical protein OERS_37860 [Oerskovia enterophila]